MIAKTRQQHLTVFLLKKSVKKFEDAIKDGAAAGKPTALNNQNFRGSLYLPVPLENPPEWIPFVQSGFPGQDLLGNRTASALVFLRAQRRIFALTFGHARHFLDPDSFERDFGLRIVVNCVSKDNIRSINLRIFKETPVKRQEEAAKGTGLQSFGVDIQQDLLRGVSGVPEDKSLASRVSGTDSLSLDVAVDFRDLPAKCKELLTAYTATEYATRGFDWIDNLRAVRSPAAIARLDTDLLKALKAKDPSIQMLCPDSLSGDSSPRFQYQGENADAEVHTELEMSEWQSVISTGLAVLTVEKMRERRVRAVDGDGTKLGEAAEHDCFVFETNVKGSKYVLSNGEWFEVATNFDADITKYVNGISKYRIALPDCFKAWGEDEYVAHAAKAPGLMSMHKKTCVIGGTPIEPCDLLDYSGALVHVKVWTASATFSHLLAQGAVSAESLLRYSEFRDHVVDSATKHKSDIRQLFPTDGFVTSKVDVVLALVRKISKPLPFFSRLNLMREGQRIERLGYRVSYQRIKVK